jgi:hypothetical protein
MCSKHQKLPRFTGTCSTFSLVLHVHTVVTSKLIKLTIQRTNWIILRLEYITRFQPSKDLDVPEFYKDIKEKPVTTLTLV